MRKKKVGLWERTLFFALDAAIAYAVLRYAFHAPQPALIAYVWASVSTQLYFIEKAVGSR